MIRINLLEVRPRPAAQLDSILRSGRSSTFISRREAVVGALFLVLTVGILGVLAARFSMEGEGAGDGLAEAYPNEAASAPIVKPLTDAPSPPAADPVAEAPPPTRAEQPPVLVGSQETGSSEHAVTAVTARALPEGVEVFVEVQNAPAVRSFRVDAPPRLVFDIPEANLLAEDTQRSQQVNSPLVSRLRIAQFAVDPPVVRLVLEIGDTPAKARVSSNASGVNIRVTAAP